MSIWNTYKNRRTEERRVHDLLASDEFELI